MPRFQYFQEQHIPILTIITAGHTSANRHPHFKFIGILECCASWKKHQAYVV